MATSSWCSRSRASVLSSPIARGLRKDRISLARDAGRRLSTLIEELGWPEVETHRFLRGGRTSIAICPVDPFVWSVPYRVLLVDREWVRRGAPGLEAARPLVLTELRSHGAVQAGRRLAGLEATPSECFARFLGAATAGGYDAVALADGVEPPEGWPEDTGKGTRRTIVSGL